MRNAILEVLQEIRPEFDFSSSEDFIREGLLDSFDLLQLVDTLDQKFNLSIEGQDIVRENFTNTEKIIELIQKTQSQHEPYL